MALKAGRYGVTKEQLRKIDSGGGGGTTVVANPEGTATADLTKLQVGETVYGVDGDTSDCYKTTDDTESAIVDADYIPFLDSSAASGEGAARKSTWSNFIAKVKSKIVHDYSSTAYNTGKKWTDNSDVYEIDFSGSYASGSTAADLYRVQIGTISDVKEVIETSLCIKFTESENDVWFDENYMYYDTNVKGYQKGVMVVVDATTHVGTVYVISLSQFAEKKLNVTVKYTKYTQ